MHVAREILGLHKKELRRNVRAFNTQLTTTSATGGGLLVGYAHPSLNATDLDPGEYSISFSLQNPPSNTNVSAVFCQAEINWKVAGQQRRRLISVASGAVISGVCEAVDVRLYDVSGQMGLTQPAGRTYGVSALLAPGSRPCLQQPAVLVTTPPFGLTPGDTVNIDIPQDAGVVSTLVVWSGLNMNLFDPANNESIAVNQTFTGATEFVSSYIPFASNQWIPLYPGADTLQVQNNIPIGTEVGEINVTVYWGIDG